MTTDGNMADSVNNNTDGQVAVSNQGTPAVDQNTQGAGNSQPANQGQNAAGTLLGGEAKPEAPAGAPEAYDFAASIPEGVEMDETITKDFSDIARGMNLTNEQANQLASYGIKYGQTVAAAVQQQLNAEVAGWGEAAKKELGSDFDNTMQLCGVALDTVEKQVPGIRQALNETGAGNRIEVIRVMRMLGELLQSDPGKLSNVGGASASGPSETWYENTKR